MNYLAHLALASPDHDLMLGGFLGDFIKGPLSDRHAPGLVRGIRLHRALDAFSDRHLLLAAVRATLPTPWRKYAGVLLDMMIDHQLARNWEAMHGFALAEFVADCHDLLDRRRDELPESAQRAVDRMLQYQWLASYADLDFTLEALRRIGQRMRFDNPLDGCRPLVEQHYGPLVECAAQLYAESQQYVAEWRAQNPPLSD